MSRAPSWTERQKETLKRLWLEGCHPKEISKAIRRSVAAINLKAHELELPMRLPQGHGPGVRATYVVTAQRLRPRDRSPIYRKGPTVDRRCLACGKSFKSHGTGNRICDPCKGTAEYRTNGDCVEHALAF